MAATGAGTVVLRPRGTNDTTYQAYQQQRWRIPLQLFPLPYRAARPPRIHSTIAAGPTGATSWGMIVIWEWWSKYRGRSTLRHINGAPFLPLYLGFHQPSVAYWGIYNNGPAIGTSACTVSDAKIKSDITNCDCNDAYHKVRAIGVKSYRKDDGIVSRKSVAFDEIGFLAQDIEQVSLKPSWMSRFLEMMTKALPLSQQKPSRPPTIALCWRPCGRHSSIRRTSSNASKPRLPHWRKNDPTGIYRPESSHDDG